MKYVVPSFGISPRSPRARGWGFFYRMPPSMLAPSGTEFLPDYSALLVADSLIMDRDSFDVVADRSSDSPFASVAYTTYLLREEGFIELEPFSRALLRRDDMLKAMLTSDLSQSSTWLETLKASALTWSSITSSFKGDLLDSFVKQLGVRLLHDPYSGQAISKAMEGLPFSRTLMAVIYGHRDLQEALQKGTIGEGRPGGVVDRALAQYLSYVNQNILLAQEYNAGLFDWVDMQPFYESKFLRVAQGTTPGMAEAEAVRTLFNVAFPDFVSWSPTTLVKALKDRRIGELRRMAHDAAMGEVTFDSDFATRTYREVLQIERRAAQMRSIVSYVTIPIGMVPVVGTPLQKAVEEVASIALTARERRNHQWFYLISDLARRKPRARRVGGHQAGAEVNQT